MNKLKACGQSLAELALCLAVVISVIMAMRLYLQRSLQARYKDGVTFLFSEIKREAAERNVVTDIKKQYDPYYHESDMKETYYSDVIKGFPYSSIDQTKTRSGSETIGPAEDADEDEE